jgi:predicted AlkP superfamily pyrophosphatase or phosphodiesterase
MPALHACGAQRTVVVIAAGLSAGHLGPDTPTLRERARACGGVRMLRPSTPAVTCTSQADLLTGQPPRHHGIVANGWMDRDAGEVRLWRQSNRLVRGPMVWHRARERFPGLTVANLFGWFNMFSDADFTVTPRPQYAADGRKRPDILATPDGLRERLVAELGPFPLLRFWGPRADIRSSDWIAQATLRVMQWHDPALTLCYLPHLDYVLQREGPGGASVRQELRELDRVLGWLVQACERRGARVIMCSEYGIEPATQVVHPNRALREAGLLRTREEFGGQALDLNASAAFAMCDHQIAHVYAPHAASLHAARECLAALPGVERVLDAHELAEIELDHARSGDLVLLARPGAWFAYPWWRESAEAPDFARTVDIHRKPGYDPCELLLDTGPAATAAKVAWFMLRKRLGFRALLRCTPLDASLVKGTHGRVDVAPEHEPVLLAEGAFLPDAARMPLRAVHDAILRHLSGEPA